MGDTQEDIKERAALRQWFEFKVGTSIRQKFEDFFTRLMDYYDPDFKQVKPQGRYGDGGCDGYNAKTKTYYQVYAPAKLEEQKAKTKFTEDYKKIKKTYKEIKKYYFVVNDHYDGVGYKLEESFEKFIDSESIEGEILRMKNLEEMVFSLEKDKTLALLSFAPDAKELGKLDYSALNEVIEYINALPVNLIGNYELNVPDWDKKIQFNGISKSKNACLDFGTTNLGDLEKYLNERPVLSDSLAKQVIGSYLEIKEKYKKDTNDEILNKLIQKMLPRDQNIYATAVYTICAKYFECCDILEYPESENK